MSDKRIKTLIADTFLEVADALETGQYGKKPVIGFASEGSEHGEDNIKRAMELAAYKGLDARLIEGEDIQTGSRIRRLVLPTSTVQDRQKRLC